MQRSRPGRPRACGLRARPRSAICTARNFGGAAVTARRPAQNRRQTHARLARLLLGRLCVRAVAEAGRRVRQDSTGAHAHRYGRNTRPGASSQLPARREPRGWHGRTPGTPRKAARAPVRGAPATGGPADCGAASHLPTLLRPLRICSAQRRTLPERWCRRAPQRRFCASAACSPLLALACAQCVSGARQRHASCAGRGRQGW